MSRMLAGAIGDGVFKVVLGAAFVLGNGWGGELLGVPAWLMAASGAALLIGGGIEVVHVRRRPMATCLRLMIAYDSGWVVASGIALVMAWQGSTAGGELWVVYLTVAPLVMAALLVRAPAATSVRASAPNTPAA
ncbi:hypothetical protein [Streptomyces sp. NPDC059452]|uniref:hypothetical protein n=1 Tax=Streptomyces sp. NPDC059452 TaxID=3346835 RepID=UPI0036AC247D